MRARLSQELATALPRPRRGAPTRPVALALAIAGLSLLVLGGVRMGESAGAVRLRAADRAARDGDVAGARGAWLGMWSEGGRSPALAARLAWVELTEGRLAPATVWVLRGERWESRDLALAWVSNLVREGGGLAGARPVRLPLRRLEWAMLALALGVGAGALWPRRAPALALVVLALAVACVEPVENAWAARVAQAVVARSAALEDSGLQLDAGQVVELLGREGVSARVRAGRDLVGRVPADALLPVAELR